MSYETRLSYPPAFVNGGFTVVISGLFGGLAVISFDQVGDLLIEYDRDITNQLAELAFNKYVQYIILVNLFLIILIADNYSHYAQILVRIDGLEEERIFLRYNWWQNGCWPLISVFLTTYGCWYVLNNVIFPRFWPQKPFHLLAFWGLIGVFLLTGVWNYLYFSKELALRQDSNYQIIGAKVVSNYRLLYVVVKAVAFFAILSAYTILSQMYQWTLQLSNDQKSQQTKVQ